jgi:hypothetical protein
VGRANELGKEPAAVCCEYGNEHSGFIEGGEFLDCVADHQLIKELFN